MSEKQWLEQNIHYETIDEKKLESIFYFSLVWNIFEKECCDKYAEIRFHPRCLAKLLSDKVDITIIDGVFIYFKNRYVATTKINSIFNNFQFGRENNDGQVYKDFTRKVLINHHPSSQEKLQALLYIAFRLRNNLFHGIKEVEKLYEQNENFKQINSLLIAIIEQKSYCR